MYSKLCAEWKKIHCGSSKITTGRSKRTRRSCAAQSRPRTSTASTTVPTQPEICIARLVDHTFLEFPSEPLFLDDVVHDAHALAVPAQQPSLLGIIRASAIPTITRRAISSCVAASSGAIPFILPEATRAAVWFLLLAMITLAQASCGHSQSELTEHS